MGRSGEVLAELAATDGVDSINQGIGDLRERLQEVRTHIDGCRAQLEQIEREARVLAVSLGLAPSAHG